MKILILGNSQAATLKIAHGQAPDLLGSHGEVGFYVIPGGNGPPLSIVDGRLRLDSEHPDFPAFTWPPDLNLGSVRDWDVVLVSALGYVDGGFLFDHALRHQGLLHAYGPRRTYATERLVSEVCFRRVVASELELHTGVRFLRDLRLNSSARLIIQPFPLLSDAIVEREDWKLAKSYTDPVGASRLLLSAKDQSLAALCRDTAATLLPYPCAAWAEHGFTPREFMNPADCLHTTVEYGRMVLEQVSSCLASPG